MKLEVGKYYRTRDGRKVGPLERNTRGDYQDSHPFRIGSFTYTDDGLFLNARDPEGIDLIAEWTDEPTQQGPVRTVTRTEIVPGVYGKVEVMSSAGRGVDLRFPENDLVWSRDELTAAIDTITAIRDAM